MDKYNIGDSVIVKVGDREFSGDIINHINDIYTIVYIGLSKLGNYFAITDDFKDSDIIKLVDN